MPFSDEIESQDEFTSAPIAAAEFEREWEMVLANHRDVDDADD